MHQLGLIEEDHISKLFTFFKRCLIVEEEDQNENCFKEDYNDSDFEAELKEFLDNHDNPN